MISLLVALHHKYSSARSLVWAAADGGITNACSTSSSLHGKKINGCSGDGGSGGRGSAAAGIGSKRCTRCAAE